MIFWTLASSFNKIQALVSERVNMYDRKLQSELNKTIGIEFRNSLVMGPARKIYEFSGFRQIFGNL